MSLLEYPIDKRQAESRLSPEIAPPASPRRFLPRREPALPASVAFLTAYGVPPDLLMQAMAQARRAGVRPETALMASGLLPAEDYYRALARRLGLACIDGDARLAQAAAFPQSVLAGVVPLPPAPGEPAWLLAPEGRRLDDLLALHRHGLLPRERFAIATPAHLARLVFAQRGEAIARTASHDLADRFGVGLSAISAGGRRTLAAFALAVVFFAAMWMAGGLVCVFDAEDIPEPGQLREAAARFAAAPAKLACLQGRLAIDNTEDGWLTRCFAIEYAALFDVINPGLSALRLPVPLGGTSNHFRTDILRRIGGWDAWNVTEDIDLGLRLARMGYDTDALAASTAEEAPAELKAWVRQRRRWFKGWIQTLLVHAADPLAALRGMGFWRALAAGLYVGGTLAGAMLGPLFVMIVLHDALFGRLLTPQTTLELVASTCWCFVALTGLAAAFWPPILGLRRRGLGDIATSLLLMPFYWTLSTVAAWWALADFIRNPFHWLKTEHGVARKRGRSAG